jgi:hypothetical protein
MKLKKGEFVIQLELGEIDLFDLVHNSPELDYLTNLKESLVQKGFYKQAKPHELCVNTLAALIAYIDELNCLMDTSEASKDDSIH